MPSPLYMEQHSKRSLKLSDLNRKTIFTMKESRKESRGLRMPRSCHHVKWLCQWHANVAAPLSHCTQMMKKKKKKKKSYGVSYRAVEDLALVCVGPQATHTDHSCITIRSVMRALSFLITTCLSWFTNSYISRLLSLSLSLALSLATME